MLATPPPMIRRALAGARGAGGDLCAGPSVPSPRVELGHLPGFNRAPDHSGPKGMCGAEGTRTPSLRSARPTLYQLSYSPMRREPGSRTPCVLPPKQAWSPCRSLPKARPGGSVHRRRPGVPCMPSTVEFSTCVAVPRRSPGQSRGDRTRCNLRFWRPPRPPVAPHPYETVEPQRKTPPDPRSGWAAYALGAALAAPPAQVVVLRRQVDGSPGKGHANPAARLKPLRLVPGVPQHHDTPLPVAGVLFTVRPEPTAAQRFYGSGCSRPLQKVDANRDWSSASTFPRSSRVSCPDRAGGASPFTPTSWNVPASRRAAT
jgi:hypothetical protein